MLGYAQPLVLLDVHGLDDERKVEKAALEALLDHVGVAREQLARHLGVLAPKLDERLGEQVTPQRDVDAWIARVSK